jgi:hypothetical protein
MSGRKRTNTLFCTEPTPLFLNRATRTFYSAQFNFQRLQGGPDRHCPWVGSGEWCSARIEATRGTTRTLGKRQIAGRAWLSLTSSMTCPVTRCRSVRQAKQPSTPNMFTSFRCCGKSFCACEARRTTSSLRVSRRSMMLIARNAQGCSPTSKPREKRRLPSYVLSNSLGKIVKWSPLSANLLACLRKPQLPLVLWRRR